MLRPIMIIAKARVTKPCAGLRSGQLRAKYERNRDSSDTKKNAANVLLAVRDPCNSLDLLLVMAVMTCDRASKKKNYDWIS